MLTFLLILVLAKQPMDSGLIYVVESQGIKLFGPQQGYLSAIHPQTGKLTRLTPPLDVGFQDVFQVSPDRRYAVYPHLHKAGDSTYRYLQIRDLQSIDQLQAVRTILHHGNVIAWTKDSRHFVIEVDITWAKEHHLVEARTLKMTTIPLPTMPKPKDPKGRWGHVILDVSPDGINWLTKTLLGDNNETPTGLHLVNRQTLEVKSLKHLPAVPFAQFSPDGKQLLLTSSHQIQVASVEGGLVRDISPFKSHSLTSRAASWSPDGHQICITGDVDSEKGSAMIIVDRQGKKVRDWKPVEDPVLFSAGPVWR